MGKPSVARDRRSEAYSHAVEQARCSPPLRLNLNGSGCAAIVWIGDWGLGLGDEHWYA